MLKTVEKTSVWPTIEQEYIDNYMESKSGKSSASSPGADEVDENWEDEDKETQEDFVEFKRWLNQGSPARPPLDLESMRNRSTRGESSNVPMSSGSGSLKGGPLNGSMSMPPPAPPTVAGCKCFKNPCNFHEKSVKSMFLLTLHYLG